ncbi:hypothetical protein BB560_002900 [Smittium megazygosporum]|uniref:Nucleolar protein 16 n=1 Tax=Smittium megazygosporum TaxID=133381 RepID=A0A2T9ZDL6_9FUNG|nr:hypothetical protein BB560_002900 [Smittium megazygosporum]
MANPRQRRKIKNPKLKRSRKVAKAKKKVSFKGYAYLKQHWNVSKSVTSNYSKLGLLSKLNQVSGSNSALGSNQGKPSWLDVPSYKNTDESQQNHSESATQSSKQNESENVSDTEFGEIEELLTSHPTSKKNRKGDEDYMYTDSELKNMSKSQIKKLIPKGFALIQKDSSGNVEKVIINDENSDDDGENPFNGGGTDEEDDLPAKPVAPKTQIAAELESLSKNAKKQERWCSDGQIGFAQEMINKHGLDYNAMFWDTKLNTQQHSVGQIKRIISKFLSSMS